MPSLFEHPIHQNIIYASNRRYNIHMNKNSAKDLKKFLQSGVVTIEDVQHAQ